MTPGRPSVRPRCAAAIVFAMAVEADAFEALAGDRTAFESGDLLLHEGTVSGRRIAWSVGGVGGERAARAARLLIDGHAPRVLVSAGFAGGLDPTLRRGAVVQAARVMGEHGGTPLDMVTDVDVAPLTLVTQSRIIATAAEKQALAAATGAALVDMETHAVALVAREAGLPCISVRVISDEAGDDLPREAVALARPQSALRRLGAALGAVGRRPRAALDLWRLYEHAVIDGKTLAVALEQLCRSLPATDPPAP